MVGYSMFNTGYLKSVGYPFHTYSKYKITNGQCFLRKTVLGPDVCFIFKGVEYQKKEEF